MGPSARRPRPMTIPAGGASLQLRWLLSITVLALLPALALSQLPSFPNAYQCQIDNLSARFDGITLPRDSQWWRASGVVVSSVIPLRFVPATGALASSFVQAAVKSDCPTDPSIASIASNLTLEIRRSSLPPSEGFYVDGYFMSPPWGAWAPIEKVAPYFDVHVIVNTTDPTVDFTTSSIPGVYTKPLDTTAAALCLAQRLAGDEPFSPSPIETCDATLARPAWFLPIFCIFAVLFDTLAIPFGGKSTKKAIVVVVLSLVFSFVLILDLSAFSAAQSTPIASLSCSLWLEVMVHYPNCSFAEGMETTRDCDDSFAQNVFFSAPSLSFPSFIDKSSFFHCPLPNRFKGVQEGRPYNTEVGMLNAPFIIDSSEGHDWTFQFDLGVIGVDDNLSYSPEERIRLRDKWLDIALKEHASVASFSAFSLQLIAVGAPSPLLQGAHQAALDEVVHAKYGFALAHYFDPESRYYSPGPIAKNHSLSFSRELLASCEAAAKEGCVDETLSTLLVAFDAEKQRDSRVRFVEERIVSDEARHARLAWATMRWCSSASSSPSENEEVRMKLIKVIRSHFEANAIHRVAKFERVSSISKAVIDELIHRSLSSHSLSSSSDDDAVQASKAHEGKTFESLLSDSIDSLTTAARLILQN